MTGTHRRPAEDGNGQCTFCRTFVVAVVVGLAAVAGVFYFHSGPVAGKGVDAKSALAQSSARLVAEVTAVSPGVPFEAGVLLEVPPGWHTYGKPPGDSGMAPDIRLELPPGWSMGDVRFPPVTRFADEAGVSFGYEGKALLRFSLTPPAGLAVGSAVQLSGRIDWLICRNECLPVSTKLDLSLGVHAETPVRAATWSEMAAAAGWGAGSEK